LFNKEWKYILIVGSCSHDESLLVNAYMAQGATNIQIGQIYEYGCSTGYTLASGDLVRVCKKDSTLTGSPPVCQGMLK
jgi:hypothetical protein